MLFYKGGYFLWRNKPIDILLAAAKSRRKSIKDDTKIKLKKGLAKVDAIDSNLGIKLQEALASAPQRKQIIDPPAKRPP